MKTAQLKVDQTVIFKMIWGSLIMSVGIYGYVAHMTASQFVTPEGEVVAPYHQNSLFIPLVGAAIVAAIMAVVLPKFLYKMNFGNPATLQSQNPTPGVPSQFQRHLTPFIIRCAFIEMIAVFGLIISFTTHQFESFLIFGGAAILGYLMTFPNPENLRKIES